MSTAAIPAAGRIEIAGAVIRLGTGAAAFEVVRDIDLTIAPRPFVCLLGPSGCGKSTLLGALAGHLDLARGSLALDGEPVADGRSTARPYASLAGHRPWTGCGHPATGTARPRPSARFMVVRRPRML